jgi:hypothetical protein
MDALNNERPKKQPKENFIAIIQATTVWGNDPVGTGCNCSIAETLFD